MFKKILYGILVVAIIVILALIWKEPKTKAPTIPENQNTSVETNSRVDTPASLNAELDKLDTSSGIDDDLNSIDNDLKAI